MSKFFVLALLVSTTILSVGCGGNAGVAELETYPPVTQEEQKIIDENIESLRDEH